jgi:hypothetical protein
MKTKNIYGGFIMYRRNSVNIEKDIIYCVNCGKTIKESEICVFNENIYCKNCLDEETVICDRCGKRVLNRYDYGSNNICLCRKCYDKYYARNKQNKYLHNYNYKPAPVFMGNGSRYFGVELEIDNGGKSEYNIKKLLSTANKNCENIYIKTDGSLADGLEIVTHPMTLEYHIKNMPWKKLLKEALSLGYRSHNTSTAGLHIHVNCTAFGNTVKKQEECIARILYFFENNWCEFFRFSRRGAKNSEYWAKRYGWKETPEAIFEEAKNKRKGRYTSINITNYSTIEFRIFRGTLKYNTIIAALQLVNAVCDIAVFLSDREIKNFAWSEFVIGLNTKKYKELIQYLKERRLYVNEPIDL